MGWQGLAGVRAAWQVAAGFVNSGLSQHWWALQGVITTLGGVGAPAAGAPVSYGPGTQVLTPPGQTQLLGTLGGPGAPAPAPLPQPTPPGEVPGGPGSGNPGINWTGLEGEGFPAPGTQFTNVSTGVVITIGATAPGGGTVTAPAPPEYLWRLTYLPPGAPLPSGYSGVGSVPSY